MNPKMKERVWSRMSQQKIQCLAVSSKFDKVGVRFRKVSGKHLRHFSWLHLQSVAAGLL